MKELFINLKLAFFYIILENIVLLALFIYSFSIMISVFSTMLYSFSLNAIFNARYSLIVILSLVLVYLILSMISFIYIYKAMKYKKGEPFALIYGEIGVILLIISSIFGFLIIINPFNSFLSLFSIILVYFGYALIGVSIFELGNLYNNSNLKIAGILFIVPFPPITQFLGSLIGYVSLNKDF